MPPASAIAAPSTGLTGVSEVPEGSLPGVSAAHAAQRGAHGGGELLARAGVERAEEGVLDRLGELVGARQELDPLRRGADDRAAPVALVALAFHEPSVLELVDHRDDLRREQPAQARQLELRRRLVGAED